MLLKGPGFAGPFSFDRECIGILCLAVYWGLVLGRKCIRDSVIGQESALRGSQDNIKILLRFDDIGFHGV